MKCPFCESDALKVIDSRDSLEFNAIRRRRECMACQRRFTTFETVELALQVHKRDGRFEEFQQAKLISGMELACRHTSISRDQVVKLASEITTELMERPTREVTTRELGDMVMKALQRLDPIAYIRFACVYRRLKDIDELMDSIRAVQAKDDKEIPTLGVGGMQ